IASPLFGPAKEWKNVFWNGYSNENGNDVASVKVYGIKKDNSHTLLYTLDSATHTLDISAVSAVQYPFVRLQMNNSDSVTATPYQLTKWGVEYVPVPEGAIAPNLYLNIPDTVGTLNGTGFNAKLHAGIAFKNVSKSNFDSLSLKVILFDPKNNKLVYPFKKLHPLQAGDTIHADLDLDVSSLSGWYNLYVEVNPANDQPEQHSFNNFLYKYVYIDRSRTLPVSLVDFNAALQNRNVKVSWSVAAEINTKLYEVQHSTNGVSYSKIGSVKPSPEASQNKEYFYLHENPAAGKNYYRLKIFDTDGSFKYSVVRIVLFANATSITVYPNPVKDVLNISINATGGEISDVRIMNAYGQQMWQQKVNGTVQVDMKTWASGMYMVQVQRGKSAATYKIQKQ
ncbi:MAG TPA: T9SS type A sorting domain-containing protein, partial [Segetibacter sp.]